jgi:transposase InsO family protein
VKNISEYKLAWELYNSGVRVNEISERLDKHRVTIYRWIKGIKYRGIRRFEKEKKESKRKRKRRKLKTEVVVAIKRIREETEWCGEKIIWRLEKDYGYKVSRSSVYRVLNRYYQLRSRWKKNQAKGKQPVAGKPRDVVQADTVDLGEIFAYTAVDLYTREVAVVIGDNLTNEEGGKCIKEIFNRLGRCKIFQTDNGKEFGYECHKVIREHAERHRKIHAGRKNENAYIESFHRSLRKESVGWIKYRKKEKKELQDKIDKYLVHYHEERPHLGLGLRTPAEMTNMLHLP